MIKNILLVLAIILGAFLAFMGFSAKGKLNTTIEETSALLSRNNGNVNPKIKEKDDEIKLLMDEQKQALEEKNVAMESLDKESSKSDSLQQSISSLEETLDDYNQQLARIDAQTQGVKEMIRGMVPSAGANPDLSAIAGQIESLKKQQIEKSAELEEKKEIAENYKKTLEAQESKKASLQSRLAKIKSKVGLGGVSAAISAVDTQYGFVIINRGANNSNFSQGSDLLVSRGGRFVGRLKVSSIEPTQTVCDIIVDSLKPGQRFRRGDRVTLK